MTAVGVDRAIQVPFSRARVVAIAFAALVMAVMVVPELGYVPIWDGRVYANCVMEAAFGQITMESLSCAGHPSQGWTIWMVLPQIFAPGSVAVLHLTSLFLGIMAIAAFRVVLWRAFPDPAHAIGLDLVTIAAAAHPVVISTLLQTNIDFGVYVWFFVSLAALLSSSRAGLAVAVIAGVLLCFSKETGVLAYAFAATAATGIDLAQNRASPLLTFIHDRRRRFMALAVPLAAFGLHVILWDQSHKNPAIWKHGWQETASDGFKFFDLSEPVFLAYAAGLFVLGFMWVAWLPVAVDGIRGLTGIVTRRPTREVAGANRPVLIGLTLLTIALTYVLTSFRTWTNVRYFALLYPLFLLLTYAALVRLGIAERARRIVIGIVVALFVVSAYRSVDPLSRAAYGTFDTGGARMYRMASITGEFEGPGRDQLVYNLQFTGYHHLQNALYRRLTPTTTTVVGTSRTVRWNIWTQLDTASFQRTMRRSGVFVPVYADEVDIMARGAPEAWYLEFSNRIPKERSLTALLLRYDVADSVSVSARGHTLIARRLVRREAATLP